MTDGNVVHQFLVFHEDAEDAIDNHFDIEAWSATLMDLTAISIGD